MGNVTLGEFIREKKLFHQEGVELVYFLFSFCVTRKIKTSNFGPELTFSVKSSVLQVSCFISGEISSI